MPRVIALTAIAVLELSCPSFHEPFHVGCTMTVTQRSGRNSRYSDAPTRRAQPQQLDYGVVAREVTPPS
jgi:hypothetical protein